MTRFIAELGSNHNRDAERIEQLLRASALSGADAAKVQVFRIEDLFAPAALEARPELRARVAWEFPTELLAETAATARRFGLEFGATPFGLWAIAELEPRVDFFKIASYEILWHELISECSSTGLPLIISTGMATIDEIDSAVAAAEAAGVTQLTLLHCVSGYPTPPEQCNLSAIQTLRDRYGCKVGWSDHSVNSDVVERAVSRWQASDIEVHVDLNGDGFEAGEHNWTFAQLAGVVTRCSRGGVASVTRQEMDGTGQKRPMPAEESDIDWRADASDGLRPLLATRQSLVD